VVGFKIRQRVENRRQQPLRYRVFAKKTAIFGERDGSAFLKAPPERALSCPSSDEGWGRN